MWRCPGQIMLMYAEDYLGVVEELDEETLEAASRVSIVLQRSGDCRQPERPFREWWGQLAHGVDSIVVRRSDGGPDDREFDGVVWDLVPALSTR